MNEQQRKDFEYLVSRYQSTKGTKIDWNRVIPLSNEDDELCMYSELTEPSLEETKTLLDQLVVLKLNGGLGTSMGCTAPKSTIEVRDDRSFLDLIVQQLQSLNKRYSVDIPLVLMNSFSTKPFVDADLPKYASTGVTIHTFLQNQFPRLSAATERPMTELTEDDKEYWYPPGHGDVLTSFIRSGLPEGALKGKKYVFISNADNLGGTVDPILLKHFSAIDAEFLSEQTDKTLADVKGGTLIKYDGKVKLLETAQVPAEHMDDFCSINMFKIFNTNNIWIKIPALARAVESGLDLDIIVNRKTVPTPSGDVPVIQLETAVGAGISCFKGAGVNVPRSRFLPVKTTNDLLLLQSDIFDEEDGLVRLIPTLSAQPSVKLGPEFKLVRQFDSRFRGIPSIKQLKSLEIEGDVVVGKDVTLVGDVVLKGGEKPLVIPDGATISDRVVDGEL
ncbi:UTP--glucose-1-phosphate uridylyltransferase family [Carpediemonas membranifera]|uniref:UTP--glucose-1-phosphate uridylyltransferase n=1 Tax=Carpediemonas membranifera TaxID=201153 RepID=A0A8J6E3E4_9EUKA|nr:UTP--glucose-1-phosphate uridylyltransferase family [Carpediemonas membranifera]|eukprot:KAG9395501.1 UTP--glucose-1-phosphate uridylyltransferase family [Carpediemonas membranifera]